MRCSKGKMALMSKGCRMRSYRVRSCEREVVQRDAFEPGMTRDMSIQIDVSGIGAALRSNCTAQMAACLYANVTIHAGVSLQKRPSASVRIGTAEVCVNQKPGLNSTYTAGTRF